MAGRKQLASRHAAYIRPAAAQLSPSLRAGSCAGCALHARRSRGATRGRRARRCAANLLRPGTCGDSTTHLAAAKQGGAAAGVL